MKLNEALKLKAGTRVQCPPDRGGGGYEGKVVNIDTRAHETIGINYIWVVVEGDGHKSVWPSSRLELAHHSYQQSAFDADKRAVKANKELGGQDV
jgi:hypothetical protein